MFYGQRIAQRLHGPNTVILAYGLMAGAYLGYVLLANPRVMPFFSILKGLGFGLFFTNTVRILNERTPEEWASTAQSLMSVGMFGLAPLVAGPLGGLIHDAFSPGAVFGLGILALALAALVLGWAALRGRLE
jgi:MFS family permease